MAADVEVMRVLAEAGADPNRAADDGTTPLMLAAGLGRYMAETLVTEARSLEAAALAIELGADADAANEAGSTALHGAAHMKSDALVRLLVEHGAALDPVNARGQTPLAVAELSRAGSATTAHAVEHRRSAPGRWAPARRRTTRHLADPSTVQKYPGDGVVGPEQCAQHEAGVQVDRHRCSRSSSRSATTSSRFRSGMRDATGRPPASMGSRTSIPPESSSKGTSFAIGVRRSQTVTVAPPRTRAR